MKKKMSWMIVILLLALPCLVGANSNLSTRLSKADQLYKEYLVTLNSAQILTAKTIMESLMAEYPDNAEVFWKTARCYTEYAIFAEKPVVVYEKGIEFAKKSIALKDNAEAHFWLAALYGQVGRARGILNSLHMVKPMLSELERCLALNPKYSYAYHVLAKLYLEVPGKPISIGDRKKALEYELKAVGLVPNHFPYQWALFQIYKKLGMRNEAKKVLQTIVELPIQYEFDHVYREELTAQEIKELAQKELKHWKS